MGYTISNLNPFLNSFISSVSPKYNSTKIHYKQLPTNYLPC